VVHGSEGKSADFRSDSVIQAADRRSISSLTRKRRGSVEADPQSNCVGELIDDARTGGAGSGKETVNVESQPPEQVTAGVLEVAVPKAVNVGRSSRWQRPCRYCRRGGDN